MYTPIDGHDHRWDDLGEAVKTITWHYFRMIKHIVCDFRAKGFGPGTQIDGSKRS